MQRNPFADDEAEEEEEEDGEDLRLHLSDDEDAEEDVEKNTVDEEKGGKHEWPVAYNSDGEEVIHQVSCYKCLWLSDLAIPLKSSAKKKKPRVLQISDDEESQDNSVAERQNTAGAEDDGLQEDTQVEKTEDSGLFKEPDDDLFVPFSKHSTQQATQAQVSLT